MKIILQQTYVIMVNNILMHSKLVIAERFVKTLITKKYKKDDT